jgi:TPR repeat protein
VSRGGSWFSSVEAHLHSSRWFNFRPHDRDSSKGFRCVLVSVGAPDRVTKEAELDELDKEAERIEECVPGKEMAPHNVRAFQLRLRVAEGGHAEAQYSVGMSYAGLDGGVAEDHDESVRWFTRAGEQGRVDAMTMLGVYGSTKDPATAKWLRKAAENGSWQAQVRLGDCCSTGEGFPHDDIEAYAWYPIGR